MGPVGRAHASSVRRTDSRPEWRGAAPGGGTNQPPIRMIGERDGRDAETVTTDRTPPTRFLISKAR